MARTLFTPNWGIEERLYPNSAAVKSFPAFESISAMLHGNYSRATLHAASCRVLDLACGSGYGCPMLLDAGATLVVGVDLSDSAIEHARENYGQAGIQYVQGDAQTFRWQHQFDLIVSFETIEHLDDPAALLRRVGELLAPGGTFCLSVPLGETRHIDPYHKAIFSEEEILDLCEVHGLEVEMSLSTELKLGVFQMLALGRANPQSNPNLADLFFTRRGWQVITSYIRGRGYLNFPQFYLTAKRRQSVFDDNSPDVRPMKAIRPVSAAV
jgi:SAM-dependent methyltransferase